ncbi:MAG: PrgI family protein [Candidatus Sungiibacteriota bacterium]
MRQFQVPQFIMIEDKVIGPFTIKQFLYLAGGAAIIFLTNYFFQLIIVIPVAILIGSLAGSLAFLKINEQPFPATLKHALLYALRPRLFLWKKETAAKKSPRPTDKKAENVVSSIPKISQSKLNDLAWSLDISQRLKK